MSDNKAFSSEGELGGYPKGISYTPKPGVFIVQDNVRYQTKPMTTKNDVTKATHIDAVKNKITENKSTNDQNEVTMTTNKQGIKDGDDSKGKKMNAEDRDLSESLLDIQSNGSAKFVIDRPVFSQQKFDEGFEPGTRPQSTLRQSLSKAKSKCQCSRNCCLKFLYGIFPFFDVLKEYNVKKDLSGDIVSGLTVGIMHIPQGMAYGMLTGLPPVYGLYASFFPTLVYFFLGTSRHVSMGTFAVASLMIGSALDKHMPAGVTACAPTLEPTEGVMINGTENSTFILMNSSLESNGTHDWVKGCMTEYELEMIRLKYAMAITFVSGAIHLIMGLTHLGFVTTYLSDPLVSGFTTGAACHVFTSQIKHIFGITTGRYSGAFKLVYTYIDFFKNIPMTNPVTIGTSLVCLVILYCVKEFINNNPKIKPKLKMPVPIELIVVILGTVISLLVKLNEDHEVDIVGDIPTGLPAPKTPDLTLAPDVIGDTFALAIVVFAVSVSMGKILSKNYEYEIDANQELLAYAACNIVSSFFSAYTSSASLSRSLVQEHVGGRTQIAGIFSCILLLFVLLLLGPYFSTLPKAVLASIIIIALKGMFKQLLELPNLWRLSKIDFIIWIVTFLATAVLDVDLGLMTGVGVAILTIVYRVQRPYSCLLGQMPETDIYRDVSVYKEAVEIPDVKIFRFENALFFVSVDHFRGQLYKFTTNPKQLHKDIKAAKIKLLKERNVEFRVTEGNLEELASNYRDDPSIPGVDFSTVIIDCSNWSFIDSMGIKTLKAVINEFKAVDIKIYLTCCKSGVREMFDKTGFFDVLATENLFVSIHDAVLQARHQKWMSRKPKNGSANNELIAGDISVSIGEIAEDDETVSKKDSKTNL
ncbi:LOW QUALITY PROTEIN: prestin-like [Pecten maximus]|uniref:LOW QUALITY PROTEIN: prestin-like n=1 Tax=Pecten maximus TaxID=6579 RepID=UPI0014585DDC|nr:LOW QUALITY PROTEIN: prestin-like [Pecten maximus]